VIRLFVAIDLPESVANRLEKICHGLPGARWVKPEQLHLTLRFIGEVDGGSFADIREILGSIKVDPFTMQLDGVGFFPPRGKPRVIWAGVAKNENLLLLQRKIETTMVRQVGLDPEERKYSPHITLARLNNTPSSRVGRFMEEYGLFLSEPFTVERFLLYSSVLGKKGALHRMEAEYQL
jgi:2'-5' RNA ligase